MRMQLCITIAARHGRRDGTETRERMDSTGTLQLRGRNVERRSGKQFQLRKQMESPRKGLQRCPEEREFSACPEGIQGAFQRYSRGIPIQKKVFRNMAATEPRKTNGFLTRRTWQGDFELPYYNINRGRGPKNWSGGRKPKIGAVL